MSDYETANYMGNLGWGLVNLQGKMARGKGWPDNPVTVPENLSGPNVGLNHAYSGTCTLDIDHVAADYALSLCGIDLSSLLEGAPYKIIGNPDNPPKPLFRLPPGVDAQVRQLRWPDPDGRLNKNGKIKMVTIFELRGGHGCQDVLPPSIHPDTSQEYTWTNGMPTDLDAIPYIPDELLKLWLSWSEYQPVLKDGCPWVEGPTAPSPHRPKYSEVRDPAFDVSIVQKEFNNRFSPGDILERNGYVRKGSKWLCPSSSTGLAGVVPFENGKIWSHHGSDELSDGYPHDAYDCYVILEHDGNKSAAWHTAKADLGLDTGGNDNQLAAAPKQEAPAPSPELPKNDLTYHKNIMPHLAHIKGRWGLTRETVEAFRLGYCEECPTSPYSASFTSPYYDSGHLLDIRHQLLAPNGQGDFRPEVEGYPVHLFNLDNLSGEFEDWVILVEREFQTMLLHQHFLPVVGLPQTFKREWVADLAARGIKKVYVALNPANKEAAWNIAKLMAAEDIDGRVSTLPFSPRDMLVKYGCSSDDFYDFIRQGWGVV